MQRSGTPFFGWPGWGFLGYAFALGIAQCLWWFLVYHGANFLTERHALRVRVHFDWETRVPFVPAAVLFYLSIYPLFWAAPFILRSRRELFAANLTFALVILAAGFGFLLIPAEPAFSEPGDLGMWTRPVRFAKDLALRHNLVPSLHVALCVICVAIYARRAGPLGKTFLWSWSAAVALAALLMHQHYVVDAISGFALGYAGVRGVYDRVTR